LIYNEEKKKRHILYRYVIWILFGLTTFFMGLIVLFSTILSSTKTQYLVVMMMYALNSYTTYAITIIVMIVYIILFFIVNRAVGFTGSDLKVFTYISKALFISIIIMICKSLLDLQNGFGNDIMTMLPSSTLIFYIQALLYYIRESSIVVFVSVVIYFMLFGNKKISDDPYQQFESNMQEEETTNLPAHEENDNELRINRE
jgi:hypothetical protein